MYAPAIRVPVEQMQRPLDIGIDQIGIDEQRRREHVVKTCDHIGPIPGEFFNHHFWCTHIANHTHKAGLTSINSRQMDLFHRAFDIKRA
jgi:hypothetical protein